MKAKKSTTNGLWHVPITSVNKKDNLQLSNNRGVNPDQQEKKTTNQTTRPQVRFQTDDSQELNTATQQEHVKSTQMREQVQLEAQNQQITANAITQVPTMSKVELAM